MQSPSYLTVSFSSPFRYIKLVNLKHPISVLCFIFFYFHCLFIGFFSHQHRGQYPCSAVQSVQRIDVLCSLWICLSLLIRDQARKKSMSPLLQLTGPFFDRKVSENEIGSEALDHSLNKHHHDQLIASLSSTKRSERV